MANNIAGVVAVAAPTSTSTGVGFKGPSGADPTIRFRSTVGESSSLGSFCIAYNPRYVNSCGRYGLPV